MSKISEWGFPALYRSLVPSQMQLFSARAKPVTKPAPMPSDEWPKTATMMPADGPAHCTHCDKVHPEGTIFVTVSHYPAPVTQLACEHSWDL
jgi:hypothetical protein